MKELSSGKRLLNELLESSTSLPPRDSDLGEIQLGINEIRTRAHKLHSRKVNGQQPQQDKSMGIDGLTRGHYLLAGKVAIEEMEHCLKQLEQSRTETRGAKHHNIDLDTYLRSKKDENILSSIEQSLSMAARDFDKFVQDNVSLDWKQRRVEVFASVFAKLPSKKLDKSLDKGSAANKVLMWGKTKLLDDSTSKLNVNENYLTRAKFERYAKLINSLNNSRQSSTEFDLANEFKELFNGSDVKSRQFHESWTIISSLKDVAKKSSSFNDGIIAKGKGYLQRQFFEYVNMVYNTKVVDKGLPTIVNKVKSFIEYQKLNSNGNLLIVNGVPIWALVFYLLRAGCEDEALELVMEHQSVFKKVEQSFVPYFKAFVTSQDKRLPPALTNKIQDEFNNHIKKSLDGDPYRYAVYKIIGRCQLNRRNISNIALTVEDWLWMHLMLIQEDQQDHGEKYTLGDFQQMIKSYGETKFKDNYLQVLLLSGMFDDAVSYAMGVNEMDGVHLSIGLAYYGLLQASVAEVKARGEKFTKLMGSYIKSFKFTDPRIAVEYLILIPLFAEQSTMCHESLRELILETREFAILLGKINSSGVRIPGKIEQRKSLINLDHGFLNTVTEQAAIMADKEGRILDGLLLYSLAEEYEIVISIINRLLGEYLSNTELDQSLIDDGNAETNPVLIAENFLKMQQNVSMERVVICKRLLAIADIRQLFIQKDYEETLTRVEELDIIPVNATSMLATIRLKSEELSYLDESLLKNVPNLLIMAMRCISAVKEQIGNSVYNGIKEERTRELKLVAKNCVVFAGMVQYKMPREVFSLLIGLEAAL